MCEQDIETRRARDLERYHRRVAERRAKGLCLKCGKRPPAPHRSQCAVCTEKRRPADLARYHQRTAERVALGLCPKCGQHPPEPGRSQCGGCAEKDRAAGRVRDARLRAAGLPRRDRERATAYERERSRREAAERRAAGLCLDCGKAPAAEGRTACEPCAEKRRARERAKYARAKDEGKLYGGRKVETRRRIGRERSRKRDETRRAAGLCTACGRHPPVEGGATCESCREARRAAERALYAARRAAGLCGSCGGPTTDGGSRCAPCAVAETARYPRRNAARREEYAKRKAKGLCTDCGEPAQGAARCEPCARRSHERSAYFRAMPVYDPQFTVVDLDTGDEHGPYDSWEDVALAMAFARLAPERVEVITDAPAITGIAAWA